MHSRQNELFGFTLVELIVVITIVGILSTVGFVSYSGYLTGARDSNRISQLTKLSDSLQVYSASKTLPLPDNSIEITASGTLIAYQGEVGVDVLETIDYTNGGTDPKDDSYYTYYLTKDRNSLQLMALMEEQSSTAELNIQNETLAQFENRYPKVYGRKLGILISADSNVPIQLGDGFQERGDIDIVLASNVFKAYISDDKILVGTGAIIRAAIPNASCNRIKQTGGSGNNGTYTISPTGTDFNVYCDMETAGGGWTMVARSFSGSTATSFGWLEEVGSIDDDNEAYSMGIKSQELSFDEIMLTTYSSSKNIDLAIGLEVDDSVLKNTVSVYEESSSCEEILGITDNACDGFIYWGIINDSSRYTFNAGDTGVGGMSKDGIGNGPNKGNFVSKPGMIFVK